MFADVNSDDNSLDFEALADPTPGSAPLQSVPEPGSALLGSAGLLGLAILGRRDRARLGWACVRRAAGRALPRGAPPGRIASR